MDLPGVLVEALSQLPAGIRQAELQKEAQNLSLTYRSQEGLGSRLVTRDMQATAYAAARMPATYGAVAKALGYALAELPSLPHTLLDVGAGTGAAAWAAAGLLQLDEVTCLEREAAMRRLGQDLMQSGPPVLKSARWLERDLVADDIHEQAGLVIAAYVLNEMTASGRAVTVKKLWQAAGQLLLLVEPGTPAGYKHLIDAREQLFALGAFVSAPCPHERPCPLDGADWCHLTCRISRTRLHKQLKGGEAAYEDEKFSYMAFVREPCAPAHDRILRHPLVRKGHVMLSLCTRDGLQKRMVTKKDGEVYRFARDASAGDAI